MLYLNLEAPFAACRTFTAGWYRPSAGFLTPSAAYGLVLNVACIESRLREEEDGHDGSVPATLMRPGLPTVKIALGVPCGHDFPKSHTIYQQLHNYPVGKDAGISPELAKGNKNNISPVRREILSDLRAVVGLIGSDEFENQFRRGLLGELNGGRYGLPFLGDNQFLVDRLEIVDADRLPDVRWYEQVGQELGVRPREHTTRLTIWIDRADMSKTRSALYAPAETATREPPESAWTAVCPPL